MRPDDSRWEARRISSGARGVSSTTEVGHFVQFYETERFLVDSVADFFATGLTAGEIALGIGTSAHGQAIAQELESRGINLSVAERRKRYTWLDATETMSMFIAEKRLDDRSFGEVIGTIISSLASENRPIRIFGEMVNLLWADGNQEAAVRLEELWNELAKAHTFTLLCAYPMNGFTGVVNVQPFNQICACHSRVFPAESYSDLRDLDQELRTVTQMQQKVASLDAEVRRRAKLEGELRVSEQRFRSLVEVLPAGVYTCEAPTGKIQFYNRHAPDARRKNDGLRCEA
jgi:PAS domain-containing protein